MAGPETDPHLNPMGAKGIGEIGITGTAAAIGNAVHHATGRRIRDLPITPAELLTSREPQEAASKAADRLQSGDLTHVRPAVRRVAHGT